MSKPLYYIQSKSSSNLVYVHFDEKKGVFVVGGTLLGACVFTEPQAKDFLDNATGSWELKPVPSEVKRTTISGMSAEV